MLRHGFVDANGVRLHYAAAGEGKLILFLHGFPEFWYAWRAQLEEFGRDHLAVAPDQRGYNLSSKPPNVADYEIDKLVADVIAFAEALGHQRFTLVAHDWGGGVAWTLAIRHPERVERLVIINSPHPATFERELNHNPIQQKASQYTLLFQTPKAEATLSSNNYQALADTMLTAGLASGHFTEADKQAYLSAWSQPGALTGSLNWYRAAGIGPPKVPGGKAKSIDTGVASPVCTVPTLVIWGDGDSALVEENLDGLEAYVPDLTVQRIPDATHWVIHERPALVNQLIREFIARRPT